MIATSLLFWFGSLLSLCIFLLIFFIFVVLLGMDCYLLRYNPEFMLVVVHLNMLCFYCDYEMPENPSNICIWCCFSHLIRRFTDDSRCEASFEDLSICFLLCSIFMHFSLLRPPLWLDLVRYTDYERGSCSLAWGEEKLRSLFVHLY